MGQNSRIGMASLLFVGAALSGCQSNSPWRDGSPANAGLSQLSAANNPNASAAARPWGTNTQPGMLPGTPGIQPASGLQASANGGGATGFPGTANQAATANPWGNSRPGNYSGNPAPASLTSRQTDMTSMPSTGTPGIEKGQPAGSNPVRPLPPTESSSSGSDPASGTYTIPAPKAYSPPPNSEVKTRVPGDDN